LAEVKYYFLPKIFSDHLLGPTSLLFNGYQCLFLGIKRLGYEVKNSVHLDPRLMYAFEAWTGINLRDDNCCQTGGITKGCFAVGEKATAHRNVTVKLFRRQSVRSEDNSTIELRQKSLRL